VAGKKSTAKSAKNLTFYLPHQQKGVNKINKFCSGNLKKKLQRGNAKPAYIAGVKAY
jgi:hypothetical protein